MQTDNTIYCVESTRDHYMLCLFVLLVSTWILCKIHVDNLRDSL